jgi:hypothetical protein
LLLYSAYAALRPFSAPHVQDHSWTRHHSSSLCMAVTPHSLYTAGHTTRVQENSTLQQGLLQQAMHMLPPSRHLFPHNHFCNLQRMTRYKASSSSGKLMMQREAAGKGATTSGAGAAPEPGDQGMWCMMSHTCSYTCTHT